MLLIFFFHIPIQLFFVCSFIWFDDNVLAYLFDFLIKQLSIHTCTHTHTHTHTYILTFLHTYIRANERTGDALLIATEKLKQSGLIYSLRLDMVINSLRFAKILSIANKLFGPTGVAVLEELAVHGRYGIRYT